MKVYIANRYKDAGTRQELEALCDAVHDAGLKDFHFGRDIERYRDKFTDPKELWARIYDELGACDALLIDVSGHPTSSRLVEMGMAYALRKPVIVVEKEGTHHKELFYGVSAEVIKYKDLKDLTKKLKKYDTDRSFNLTDKTTLFAMFLVLGAALSWFVSQYFIPLGFIVAVVYWIIVRQAVATMRVFDRVVIYIPLAIIWVAGFLFLKPLYLPLALAWAIGFWIVILYVLRKIKLAL